MVLTFLSRNSWFRPEMEFGRHVSMDFFMGTELVYQTITADTIFIQILKK